MLNDGEEYLKIVTIGVSRPSKPMYIFKTSIAFFAICENSDIS